MEGLATGRGKLSVSSLRRISAGAGQELNSTTGGGSMPGWHFSPAYGINFRVSMIAAGRFGFEAHADPITRMETCCSNPGVPAAPR